MSFYIICALLIVGILFNYSQLRKGRGSEYVYIIKQDPKHYFLDYKSAKKHGSGVRMISKKVARAKNYTMFKGDNSK